MIVCVCHRVSDRDIARAVQGGTRSFDLLQDDTGVATACGCCRDYAERTFDKACAERHGCSVPAKVSPKVVPINLAPACA